MGSAPDLPYKSERWLTPDADFLDLDFFSDNSKTNNPRQPKAEKQSPTVLLLHGFEGSSRALYILGMAQKLRDSGFQTVALNFRSCSGEINKTLPFYHSGETRDLDWVIKKLNKKRAQSPLFVLGFSLGGNVLLKWLGEQQSAAEQNIRAAMAISVPFDLGIAAKHLDRSYGGLYGQNFLKTLKQKLLQKEKLFPGRIDCDLVKKTRSYLEFENRLFAPLHGFKDAKDYWRQCSAQYFVHDIALPTLILHAEDDPFLPGKHLPLTAFSRSKGIVLEHLKKGGHVGFVEGTWPGAPHYFAENRALHFFSNYI